MEAPSIQMATPESINTGKPAVASSVNGSGEHDASFDRVLSEVASIAQDRTNNETDTSDADGETAEDTLSCGQEGILGNWLLMNSLVPPTAGSIKSSGQITGANSDQAGGTVAGVGAVGQSQSTGNAAGNVAGAGAVGQSQSTGNAAALVAEVSAELSLAEQTAVLKTGRDVKTTSKPTVEGGPVALEADPSSVASENLILSSRGSPRKETTANSRIDNGAGESALLSSDDNSSIGKSNEGSSQGDAGHSGNLANNAFERIQKMASEATGSSNQSVSVENVDLSRQSRIEMGNNSDGAIPQSRGIGESAVAVPTIENAANSKGADLADSLVKQIDQAIQILSFPRRREVKVTLEPESLGKLNISIIQEKGGSMVVRLSADNPVAKEMIESRVQELKAAFDRHGLKIEGFSVDLGQNPAFSAGDPGKGYSQGESNGRPRPDAIQNNVVGREDRSVSDLRIRSGTGLVDLRV